MLDTSSASVGGARYGRRIALMVVLLLIVGAMVAAAWHFWPSDPQARAAAILDDVRSGRDPESTSSSLKAVACGSSPAIAKLTALGPAAVPVLQSALNDRNSDVRICAAWTLAAVGDQSLLSLLAGSRGEETSPLARGVALHKALADAVMAAVHDPNRSIAKRAVAVLSIARRGDSLAALASVVNDKELGGAAIWGLGDIGTPEALDAVAGALFGPCEPSAAYVLATHKDKRGTPALLRILQEEGSSVRVISLLANLEDPRAISAYRQALGGSDGEARRWAAKALIAVRTRQVGQDPMAETRP